MNYEDFSRMVDERCEAASGFPVDASDCSFRNGLSDSLRAYLLSLEDEATRAREVAEVSEEIDAILDQ